MQSEVMPLEAGVAVVVISVLICTRTFLGLQMLFMAIIKQQMLLKIINYCHAGNYGCQ